MAASGWCLVFQRMFISTMFQIAQFFYMTTQSIGWSFNGTSRKIRESYQPENYERSAQVLNVKLIYKFDYLQPLCLDDFIYSHDRFEDPQYIIDNEHITLITVADKYALFGEAKEKDMHLWKYEYSPFIRMAQMEFCSKLIIVPRRAFHRMSEIIGDPKAELIFLINVARCGSTLFGQIMEMTGQCVSISEPDAPNQINLWCEKYGPTDELREVTRDSIRWTCRPYKSINPKAYAVKLSIGTSHLLHLMKECYPNSRYFLMYRDYLTVAKSVWKLTRVLPTGTIAMSLGKIHGYFTQKCFEMSGYAAGEFRIKLYDDLTFGLFLHYYMCKTYMEFRQEGLLNIKAIRYEDLITDTEYACAAILRHCGLSESLTPLAMKGMEQDSQRNSPISKEILSRFNKELTMTERTREVVNNLLQKHGLPLLDGECLLPGTITLNEKKEIDREKKEIVSEKKEIVSSM